MIFVESGQDVALDVCEIQHLRHDLLPIGAQSDDDDDSESCTLRANRPECVSRVRTRRSIERRCGCLRGRGGGVGAVRALPGGAHRRQDGPRRSVRGARRRPNKSNELLPAHVPRTRVVNLQRDQLGAPPRPWPAGGSPDRPGSDERDDADAKATVEGLIDEIGSDAVDARSLEQGGRRHQPGSALYGADLSTAEVRRQLECD